MTLLGAPRQIAYAVSDVWVAASQWVQRGVGPFFINEHIPVANARVFGESAAFDHSSAYAQWGSVMVELITQHDPGPRPVVDQSGLHHMAFFVEDFDDASRALKADGFAEVLYGEAGSMPFAMFGDSANDRADGDTDFGHFIEIYPGTPRLRSFYDMIEDAAAGWDGKHPIRST